MKPPPEYFRAGVGAVVAHRDGRVLALERADHRGAWQLPQGGLERDEEPIDGVYREIAEETGLRADALALVDRFPDPLAYELPPAKRSAKTGRGQVQYWFLFRLIADAVAIDVTAGREFCRWRWTTFDDLVAGVAAFRQPIYHRLLERFGPHLAGAASDPSQ
jgi:putative (di)nucleoside polyphosphate hydrolase